MIHSRHPILSLLNLLHLQCFANAYTNKVTSRETSALRSSTFGCLGNLFQMWRGNARHQAAGIIWEDGSQQFFGIFQTHEAGSVWE